jgi:hypothetical protein
LPTPEEWRFTLECQLDEQARDIDLPDRYYDGDHRMAFVTAKYREAFGEIFDSLVDNWCEIVVDAPVERLGIDGFRIDGSQEADDDAWKVWKANRMASQSVMAHTEAVKLGAAYVMVAPGDPYPRITIEHPAQFTIAFAPGDRNVRLAAFKRWTGDDGHVYATLYLPETIHKWRTKEAGSLPPIRGAQNPFTRPFARLYRSGKWEKVEQDELWEGRDEIESSNPLGQVPAWEIPNNPSMLYGGRSDLLPAIPLQDAINKEIADMLIASEFAAFPQRVLMGVEVPTDEHGEPLPEAELKAAMSRVWMFENESAKIGEFKAADLKNYVEAVTVLLQHLAAQTRTPPHYLLGQIVNASGDALKAAETGLVSKVKRKQKDFSDGWQDAMRAALGLMGREVEPGAVEVIWTDPEFRSEGELIDAALKLKQLGIPFEAIWERIGAKPEQIKRWAEDTNLTERREQYLAALSSNGTGATPQLEERNARGSD